MHLVSITDLHGHTAGLADIRDELASADVVLLTGDLTHFGDGPEALRVVQAVADFAPCVRAVSGNCDQRDVAAALMGRGLGLDGRAEEIAGVWFVGLGGSLPCPGRTPNEYTEGELSVLLRRAAERVPETAPVVLVSHQPPFDTGADILTSGEHVGSVAVRRFIEERRPIVCFTGHIHESSGVGRLGQTAVVNPGPFRSGGYAIADITDDFTATVRCIRVCY